MTTFKRSEFDVFGMSNLSTDCYIECGAGSTLCYYKPSGFGLSTAFMAVRSTPATKAAFDVDVASVTPGWSEQRHVTSWMYGRVNHGALSVSLFPNAQYWPKNKARFQSTNMLTRAKPYLVTFNRLERMEKRAFMETDGRWLVGDAWDVQGDDDDDDDVVVC